MHKREGTARRHSRHSVRVLNMKYMLEFVFMNTTRCCFVNLHVQNGRTNTRYDVGYCFCQLRKWRHPRMPGRVYRPVRPLFLIYNSMTKSDHGMHPGPTFMELLFKKKQYESYQPNTTLHVTCLITMKFDWSRSRDVQQKRMLHGSVG